ncbi:hypothetical protein D3C78_704310 [compost metagenome]
MRIEQPIARQIATRSSLLFVKVSQRRFQQGDVGIHRGRHRGPNGLRSDHRLFTPHHELQTLRVQAWTERLLQQRQGETVDTLQPRQRTAGALIEVQAQDHCFLERSELLNAGRAQPGRQGAANEAVLVSLKADLQWRFCCAVVVARRHTLQPPVEKRTG